MLCKQLALLAGALGAIDGRKCKAVNAKERTCTPDQLTPLLQPIDQRVAGDRKALDGQANPEEVETPGGAVAKNLQAKREALQQRTLL